MFFDKIFEMFRFYTAMIKRVCMKWKLYNTFV